MTKYPYNSTYVFDTSVLIKDPKSITKFKNSNIILPVVILEELDKLKKGLNEAAKQARLAIRTLDEISVMGDISEGFQLEDYFIKVDSSNYSMVDHHSDKSYGDNSILSCAYHLSAFLENVTLLTNDINLRVKARSCNVNSKEYVGETDSLEELFSGVKTIQNNKAGYDLKSYGEININEYDFELLPNECVNFVNEQTSNSICIGRKSNKDTIKVVRPPQVWGLSSKNREQAFAIDLMLDKNIDLVTLIGKAGSGKSIVALATALELVLNRKAYDKLVIYRPIQAVSAEIGFIPGPQPLDAKILTPNGWTTMGELKPGSKVISRNGLATEVLKVFPKGKKDVYKITTSYGTTTECCLDHLWYTRTKNTWSVKSTKQILNSLNDTKHFLPNVEPVKFKERKVQVHPYVLGAYLNNLNLEVPTKVRNFIKKLDSKGPNLNKKYIPDSYKFNSTKTRMFVLQGLMDVCGKIKKNGQTSILTDSEVLAKDIFDLVFSLGGSAKVRKDFVNYKVSINLDKNPFLVSQRKQKFNKRHIKAPSIVSIELVGQKEVQCILVKNSEHLYVTDDFIVTHNTIEEKLEPWFQAIMDNFESLFSSTKNASWRKELEMYTSKNKIEFGAITYVRGRSIPDSIILIDEAQNLTKDDLKTLLTRAGEGTKIILTGDIEQIDNSRLDTLNNGLTYVIDKFKDSELAGHITFVQGERSRLATKAAEIM